MTEKYDPFVIAILFGDNDFYTTFMDLLTILKVTECRCRNKETLLKIINNLVYPSYRLNQNRYRYTNGETTEEHSNRMKRYLSLEEDQLLIGHVEVDEYLSKTPWNNSETFVLDTRLPEKNQIYCI